MSQPKISPNKKDPDYGSKPKKHYDATPSNTGTTDQSIWNTILHALAPTKFAPLTPAVIVFRLFLALIIVAGLAQAFGMIDVTGFLNPKSPTYLDVNSILSPNEEGLPYGEDSPMDDVGLDDSFMGRDMINNPKEDSAQSKTSCDRYSGTSCESGTCCCSIQKSSSAPSSDGFPAMPDPKVIAFAVPENCECPTDMTDLNSPQVDPATGDRYILCGCNACYPTS